MILQREFIVSPVDAETLEQIRQAGGNNHRIFFVTQLILSTPNQAL
jgi:hypothetical protein